jgi:hypothetical protein
MIIGRQLEAISTSLSPSCTCPPLSPLLLLLRLWAAGQSVPRAQNVLGVTFSYQPPPKSIVPCAASLKELYAPPNTVAK